MASAQQPAPSCRPQSRTRHAPCALPRPPSAGPLARLPAALRLPARHRGRVLLKEAGQWGRRAETIRPMDAPLGPRGGRSPGRGGAGSDPRLLVPCSDQGLCAPLWSSRWRWRYLSSLEQEVAELKSPGSPRGPGRPEEQERSIVQLFLRPRVFLPLTCASVLFFPDQFSCPLPRGLVPLPQFLTDCTFHWSQGH